MKKSDYVDDLDRIAKELLELGGQDNAERARSLYSAAAFFQDYEEHAREDIALELSANFESIGYDDDPISCDECDEKDLEISSLENRVDDLEDDLEEIEVILSDDDLGGLEMGDQIEAVIRKRRWQDQRDREEQRKREEQEREAAKRIVSALQAKGKA